MGTTQERRRAQCPGCGTTMALTSTGRLPSHLGNVPLVPGAPFMALCGGSYAKPNAPAPTDAGEPR